MSGHADGSEYSIDAIEQPSDRGGSPERLGHADGGAEVAVDEGQGRHVEGVHVDRGELVEQVLGELALDVERQADEQVAHGREDAGRCDRRARAPARPGSSSSDEAQPSRDWKASVGTSAMRSWIRANCLRDGHVLAHVVPAPARRLPRRVTPSRPAARGRRRAWPGRCRGRGRLGCPADTRAWAAREDRPAGLGGGGGRRRGAGATSSQGASRSTDSMAESTSSTGAVRDQGVVRGVVMTPPWRCGPCRAGPSGRLSGTCGPAADGGRGLGSGGDLHPCAERPTCGVPTSTRPPSATASTSWAHATAFIAAGAVPVRDARRGCTRRRWRWA